MIKKRLPSFILFIITLLTFTAAGARATEYHLSNDKSQDIERVLSLNANKITPLTITQISETELHWLPLSNLSLGLPIDPQFTWFKLELINEKTEAITNYLAFNSAIAFNSVTSYIFEQDILISTFPLEKQQQKISNLIATTHYFSLTVPANTRYTLYIHVDSKVSGYIPISIVDHSTYLHGQFNDYFDFGLIAGGLSFLALSLLLFYGFTFTSSYLYASGYIFCLLLTYLGLVQFSSQILPIAPTYMTNIFLLGSAFSGAFGVLICQQLLAVKRNTNTMLYITLAIVLITLTLSVFLAESAAISLIASVKAFVYSYLAFLCLSAFHSQPLARYLLVFFISNILVIGYFLLTYHLNYLGLFQSAAQLVVVGLSANTLLLLMVLAKQKVHNDRGHYTMQQQIQELKKSLKQAERELIDAKQDAEDDIESAIQERTLELNIALQELSDVNRELEKKNTTDELSGLYNRRFFDQKFLAEYRRSKRELTPLSLVLMDIDHFKKINDTYGHLIGDACIKQVGQQIKLQLKRSSDVACRYGGEEFCLILPHTELDGALAFANSLREIIAANPIAVENNHINITISCGVVTYQQEADIELEQIFQQVDKALYLAKDSGRNNVQQLPLVVES